MIFEAFNPDSPTLKKEEITSNRLTSSREKKVTV
jgi:hypothetical protein